MPAIKMLLVVLLFSVTCFGQERKVIRVSLTVSANDVIRDQFVSNLNKSLRAINDVVIVNEDRRFNISVIVIRDTFGEGTTRGYSASVVVTNKFLSRRSYERLINEAPKNKNFLLAAFDEENSLAHHALIKGGPDIQDLCNRIVASIDADALETFRRDSQVIDDLLKKPRP